MNVDDVRRALRAAPGGVELLVSEGTGRRARAVQRVMLRRIDEDGLVREGTRDGRAVVVLELAGPVAEAGR